jgi:hypothetical protein
LHGRDQAVQHPPDPSHSVVQPHEVFLPDETEASSDL